MVVKNWITVGMLGMLLAPLCFGKDKKNLEPVMWGTLDQNVGCVIFQEHRKIRGMYWGVAVTTSESYELDVVETENYDLDQKKFKEDQDGMNELQRIAARDRIKFVKIPGKVTPELLDEARALCKGESQQP
jgi:hypothetical protein